MTLFGNDIIDLTLAEKSLALRERFLKKAFCSSERDLILSSKDSTGVLWLLWSMKESAYKAHVRMTLEPKLNPICFVCQLSGEGRGRVLIDSSEYHTQSFREPRFIHTIAFSTYDEPMGLKSVVVRGNSHDTIRQRLLREVKRCYSVEKKVGFESVEFKKDHNGFPAVKVSGSAAGEHPCSISHHGSYGAYAIAFGEASD